MSEMGKAYKLAALAVRQRFREQHPEYLDALDHVRKHDVAVYPGSYDSVQEVLKCLSVPFKMDPDAKKTDAAILFVNCSGSFEKGFAEKIAAQVERGKWLVTSDWALRSLIQEAFPGTVRSTDQSTRDEVVSAEPCNNSLWSEVVVLGADPQWWLEGSSYPIEVLDGERVRVEAASHDLLARYNAPVVAVSFDWGAGHVFHTISHFWHKRTRTPGPRYSGPCIDFLKAGMRLSDEGIEKVMRDTRIGADEVNFAMIQSAATATELVAQLSVKAMTASF